jgi:hypothetical protein
MIIDLPARPGLRIMVTSRPVDFRRGMDSISTLVKETLAADPFAGDVFVFRSKRAEQIEDFGLGWLGPGAAEQTTGTGALHVAAGAVAGCAAHGVCGAPGDRVRRSPLYESSRGSIISLYAF